MNTTKSTIEITIQGLVQGIGYRPFVAETATGMGLSGFVRNTDGVVTIVVSGGMEDIEDFKKKILSEAPKLAKITGVSFREADHVVEGGFRIEESDTSGNRNIPYIPPDIATCKSCERELFDKSDRRYRHPFISCVDCGPRYSILEDIPYDRPRLTMKKFPLCAECEREYTSPGEIIPGNRRRHAQTVACRDCGPRLSLCSIKETEPYVYSAADDDILNQAIIFLKNGGILATMDIGGFHLVCLADNEDAVCRIREIKHRSRKPFAVMFRNADDVKRCAAVSAREQELLESNARPVVLLKQDGAAAFRLAPSVCANSPYLGAMLPCNPLQMLLVSECGPLIATSANRAGDLMITDPEEMLQFAVQDKNKIKILFNDRPISTPLDDSVVQVVADRTQIIRRARGYVPEPVVLPQLSGKPAVFAAGGDLKAAFAYFEDGKAYLSQPFGDMETEEIQTAWFNEKDRMKRLFGFVPEGVVCDAHPGYYTHAAFVREDCRAGSIYHHHAHAASVIAEHDLRGDVICVAFDGTGYGEDGTVWGSEFFHWNGVKMHRFAALSPVRLQGGSEGIRNADTILAGFIEEDGIVRRAIDAGINTVTSSSMGRLFDAASALLDICHYSEYEGEAAIELEYAAAKASKPFEDIAFDGNSVELLTVMKAAIEAGSDKNELALGFIYAIADWMLVTIMKYNAPLVTPIRQIVLSGGTFQNRILLERAVGLMEKEGFIVYTNEQVPPGDGGLALGQVFLSNNSLNKRG